MTAASKIPSALTFLQPEFSTTEDFGKVAISLREKGFQVLPLSDRQAVAIQGEFEEKIG